MADDPPIGFFTAPRSPFIDHIGPIFQRSDDLAGYATIGLRVGAKHANTMNVLHGGLTASLADSAMARALHSVSPHRKLTLEMNLQFLHAVQVGEWLEACGRVVSHDVELGHTACVLAVDGEMRARATATFRIFRK